MVKLNTTQIFIIRIFFSMLLASTGFAKVIQLSQKDVAEMILKNSRSVDEIEFRYQQLRLSPAQQLATYDWKLSAETGSEIDKSETLSSVANSEYQRLKTSVSLSKSLITGTALTFEWSRFSQKTELPSTTSQATADLLGISFEQSLWANFLGQADRATTRSAEQQFLANNVLRANELQDAVLEGIRVYWNTYVSQENFKEAQASRDRYKQLVESVRRKTSYGYANPGELAQIQAEFEGREQNVKTTSNEYLKNLDQLLALLKLSEDIEIQFRVIESIPPVPMLETKKIEQLRNIQSQKYKLAAADENLTSAKSKSVPSINLVGKFYTTGLDESVENSQSELFALSNPKYYFGVKFSYSFGSDYLTEDLINKKASRDLEKAKLDRSLVDTANKLKQAERKVLAAYSVAQSSLKQKEFREKAMNELNRTFSQGRTDISVLIDSMNKFFNSEIQYSRAVGDYQIALNEWAATRDELVTEGTK